MSVKLARMDKVIKRFLGNHKGERRPLTKLYKRWARFLKNRKRYDDYMVCVSMWLFKTPSFNTYEELREHCQVLSKKTRENALEYEYEDTVNWMNEWKDFIKEDVKWYDFRSKLMYFDILH